MELSAALAPEDLAALDRVCRDRGESRLDAVESALRWYIEREGDLPPVDDLAADELGQSPPHLCFSLGCDTM